MNPCPRFEVSLRKTVGPVVCTNCFVVAVSKGPALHNFVLKFINNRSSTGQNLALQAAVPAEKLCRPGDGVRILTRYSITKEEQELDLHKEIFKDFLDFFTGMDYIFILSLKIIM